MSKYQPLQKTQQDLNSSLIELQDILAELGQDQTQDADLNQLSPFYTHHQNAQGLLHREKVKVVDQCFFVSSQPQLQIQTNRYVLPSSIQNIKYQQMDDNLKKLIIDKYIKEQYIQRQSSYSERHIQFNKQLYINRRLEICFFKHVKVSVELSKISIYNKDSLILPFQSTGLNDFLVNKVKMFLTYDIVKQLKLRQLKKREGKFEDGDIICAKATGMQNYLGLYFLKTPHANFTNQEYCTWTLKKGISNMFIKLDQTQDRSIVIPTIEWGGLNQQQTSYLMVSQILGCISKFRNINKCKHLKEIIISVHSPIIFDQYESVLSKFKQDLNLTKN